MVIFDVQKVVDHVFNCLICSKYISIKVFNTEIGSHESMRNVILFHLYVPIYLISSKNLRYVIDSKLICFYTN